MFKLLLCSRLRLRMELRSAFGFGGAVDILVSLSRRRGRGQESYRKFQALSRFGETPSSLIIELTEQGYVSHGEDRAIAKERAQESILKVVPCNKAKALTLDKLMELAPVGRTTAQKAIAGLIEGSELARAGRGTKNNPYRYWCPSSNGREKQLK